MKIYYTYPSSFVIFFYSLHECSIVRQARRIYTYIVRIIIWETMGGYLETLITIIYNTRLSNRMAFVLLYDIFYFVRIRFQKINPLFCIPKNLVVNVLIRLRKKPLDSNNF